MDEKKIKVLYFVDRMRHGGIQTLAYEMAKNMPKNIELDFLVLNDGETYPLEEKIKKLGNKVYKVDTWLRSPLDYVRYYKVLNEFFQKHHDYNVIHINTGSKNFLILKLAKKYGIKKRIAHSHNTGFQSKNKIEIFVGNIFKYFLKKYATDYFACSKSAGEWLFGKRNVKNGKVILINNAIDYSKFKFDEQIRLKVRDDLNIKDKFVVGNIGRFTTQKNHTFLIDIFYEIYKKNKNAILMLVGVGEKYDELKQKVEKLGLSEVVYFMGYKTNINELLCAMDVFVMPSLYEGLPVVGIEAQANGIKCFMSKNVITEEIKISKCVEFVELDKSAKQWADIILNTNLCRCDTYNDLKANGYIIKDLCNKLVNLYSME